MEPHIKKLENEGNLMSVLFLQRIRISILFFLYSLEVVSRHAAVGKIGREFEWTTTATVADAVNSLSESVTKRFAYILCCAYLEFGYVFWGIYVFIRVFLQMYLTN